MISVGLHNAKQSTGDVASMASDALGTAATGSGFFVALAAYMMGTATGAAVTDNKGNTYAQVGAFLTEGSTFSGVFYCAGGAGGAGHVFTVNLAGATGYVALIVCEVLGSVGPPDQVAGWQLDTTQPMTSAVTGTTAQADELALCFAMTTVGGGTEVLTWGGTPAFTLLEGLGDTNYQTAGLGYAVLSAIGTVQATTTSSLGSTGALFLATFKASAGGVTNAVKALSATVAGQGLVGKSGKVVRKTTTPINASRLRMPKKIRLATKAITASVARARIKALMLSKALGIVATRTRRAFDTRAAGVGVGGTALRAVHVDVVGSFMALGGLTRLVGADLAAQAAASGTVTRRAGVVRAGAVGAGASLGRAAGATRAALMGLGASLAGLMGQRLRLVTMAAPLGGSAVLLRRSGAVRTASLHPAADLARRPHGVKSAGLTLSATTARRPGITRVSTVGTAAAVTRRPGVVVRAWAALVSWLVAGQTVIDMARVLTASIGLAATQTRGIRAARYAVLGIFGAIRLPVASALALSASLGMGAGLARGAALVRASLLSINAGVTRMVGVVHVFRATATAAVAKVPALVRQASTVITAQFGEDAPAEPLVNAEADVIALLRDRPGLATMVTGIFLNAADEAQPLPYIVVTGTHDRQLLLTGELDLDHVTFTVVAWATGAAVAEAIADEVQDALDADDTYAVLARTGGFDEQTANDAAVLTADRWV